MEGARHRAGKGDLAVGGSLARKVVQTGEGATLWGRRSG